MGLSSLFRRRSNNAKLPSPNAATDPVQHSRVRARHRLIGAAVLVVVGVIGFPLIFENQPRPIPVDIAIEIPRKESVPPLVMPQARVTPLAPTATASNAAPEAAISQARDPTPPNASASTASTASTDAVKTEPVAVAVARPVAPPAAPALPAATEAARAQALLDGKPATPSPVPKDAAPKDAARFVVQVGAFAENAAAHETRLKVEKLGLKTYAQVADTDAGKRIRVRVGPFASKEEAAQAKDRLKAAGFPAVLLTL